MPRYDAGMRRGLLWCGLAATAPCVVLLVALPVGLAMEFGRQVRLRVVNRTDRPLSVTPLGGTREEPDTLHVAQQSLHPFIPLPAFRTEDLPLAPGEARTLYYSARATALRSLAIRMHDGRVWQLKLPPAAARRDLESGREVILNAGTALDPDPFHFQEGRSPLFAWAVLLAGPLGTLAFLRLNRARRRPTSSENPPPAAAANE